MAVAVAHAVRAAVADGRAVVALESAIITHGLPRPLNRDVAQELEDRLGARNVVAATVAVIDGVATVGLTTDQLARLATADDATKASVRDLPVVMARGGTAGTTVAATARLAQRAGIRVFATGGLGGVHHDAGSTFDESADLPTLAATPITVVCAGVKSILDVPATLERLETLGVAVLGYRTRSFPGFYMTDSGQQIEVTVSGPDEVVAIMGAADALGLCGAVVVANPVPEAEQLDRAVHDQAIADALATAEEAGIRGPALTPYLLDWLHRATGGASLAANLAAVRNNVTVAADIALAWAARRLPANPAVAPLDARTAR
jgi:pseudouridine-5'-phosphate glycosidase